ncbi:MAG: hypothetical protein J6J87_01965 [Oscillospiraceae bacterium]|nr:hypothetical protein [Oscillospiraceae bacterium]
MKEYNGKVALYYNEEQDALEVWAKGLDDEEWMMSTSCRYRRSERENPMNDACWIHFNLINDLDSWVEISKYEFIGFITKWTLENDEE